MSAEFPDDATRQISPDGRLAGGTTLNGDIVLWDVGARRRLEPGLLAQRPVVDLSFDREGRIVVVRGTKVDPAEDSGMGIRFLQHGPPFDTVVCSAKPIDCTTVPGSKAKTRAILAK